MTTLDRLTKHWSTHSLGEHSVHLSDSLCIVQLTRWTLYKECGTYYPSIQALIFLVFSKVLFKREYNSVLCSVASLWPGHPSWGGHWLEATLDISSHQRLSLLAGGGVRMKMNKVLLGLLCCEPRGNRNGWNCISHKLPITRFTASLQYQVSFCFCFWLEQIQMCCTS